MIQTASDARATQAGDASFPDLARFFAPTSVALIGATEDLAKFGGRCLSQTIRFGYEGAIYPINPKRDQIFGRRCYPSVSALPETPDHVGILLPAAMVPAALEECASRGVPFVTVFSSGFVETATNEGRVLQQRCVEIARRGGIRFMGPNCNGMVNFVDGFALTSTATIGERPKTAGDLGVVSQSGGAGQVNVMWRAQQLGLGISYQVSCGNDADLDVLDYAAFMVESEATRVVMMLVERLPAGDRLRRLAQRAQALEKPIVMVKVGRTEAGSKAAASHTGSVTGTDAVCDAALRQLGIIRVDDCSELYETAMLLRQRKWPAGQCVAATSISGGNLVMAADIGAGLGLHWPEFSETTQRRVGEILPGFGKASNPADLTAGAIGMPGAYAKTCAAILEDSAIDALVPVLTIASEDDIRAVASVSQTSSKPVTILWTGRAGGDSALTQEALVAQGHAVYRDATPCLKSLQRTMWYAAYRRTREPGPPRRPAGIDADGARSALAGAPRTVPERLAKQILASYGLSVTREALARSAAEAANIAATYARPVALKIESQDIAHKTEAGAIRLGVVGAQAAAAAFEEVKQAALHYRPSARIEGVLVQEMVPAGVEMLLGLSNDPTFGPVLTVGMGGIFVEVFQDVAILLPPVTPREAREAIASLRSARLLQGARGAPPADVEALVDSIVRLSWAALDLGGQVEEMDINPLVVLPQGQGVKVVDALIIRTQDAEPAS